MTTYTPITREQYFANLDRSIRDDPLDKTIKLWGFTFQYHLEDEIDGDPILEWAPLDVYEPDVWEYIEYSSFHTTLQQHELEHLLQLWEEEDVTMSSDLLAILECNVRDVIADYYQMEVSL